VSWSNVMQIGRWEVARKSFRFADIKNARLCGSRSPHLPPINCSRPKFSERYRPLTCPCLPNLVRIGKGLSELFPNDWFLDPWVITIILA